MAEQQRATLHGVWASAFCRRVELALQIKGMPYQHVEEDLAHKSTLLLKYNPVYKKVPVLVHDGKPIAESLVILEYIDETWKNIGPLLPEDPFKRSVQEEILGTKIIDPEKYPLIFSWVTALNEITLVKELNPPHEKLSALLLDVRDHNLKSGAA